MKTFLLLPVFAMALSAQPFGAGLKLGATLNDAINFNVVGHGGRNFVVGPYIELRLPAGFALEADALYESAKYSAVTNNGSSWQFPVMAKYKFGNGLVRPYVEGGVAFSHITDLADIPELNHRSNFGIVVGGGLEIHALFLRITPEVRYNGWALKNIQSTTGAFQSTRNEALFLVGFGF